MVVTVLPEARPAPSTLSPCLPAPSVRWVLPQGPSLPTPGAFHELSECVPVFARDSESLLPPHREKKHKAFAIGIEVAGMCLSRFPAASGALSAPVLRTPPWSVAPHEGLGRVPGLWLSRQMTLAVLASLASAGGAGLRHPGVS